MLSAVIAAFLVPCDTTIRIEQVTYRDWSRCVRLTNGTDELIYVPAVGRVMRFAHVGGPNMLWESTKVTKAPGQWANYGGDKIWPAPQSDWNWPPDPAADGKPHSTVTTTDSLVTKMTRPTKSGLLLSRRITMNAEDGSIRFENILTNLSKKTQQVGVWQITQVNDPDRVIVPLEATDDMPNGWELFDSKPLDPIFASPHGNDLWVRRNPSTAFKLGSPSSAGILRAIRSNTQLMMSAKKVVGAKYPDGGKFLQVYANPNPDKYVEMEITGPLTKLQTGQSTTLEVTWRLSELAETDG